MRPRRRHSATYKVQAKSIIKNQCMLSRSEFFKGSSEKFLLELSTMLEVDLFLPGQDIIQQGQEGDKMYFLNWGSVQVMLGDQVVGDISSGSVFGEMALFGNGKRSCTVRATDTCDCRSVDQHRFQRLLNSYPEERLRFEKLVEGRLQETTKLKQDLRRQREPQDDGFGGSRLRNITLRSLSVIAKMGMNGLRRQDRGSHGSRNSDDATPRRPGRPTTWPTMADVQEVNEDKAPGKISVAKAVLAKMGRASASEKLAPEMMCDESQLSDAPTELGSSQGPGVCSTISSDSMEGQSFDSYDWVVPEIEEDIEASPEVPPLDLVPSLPSVLRPVALRRPSFPGTLPDAPRRSYAMRRRSAFPRLLEELETQPLHDGKLHDLDLPRVPKPVQAVIPVIPVIPDLEEMTSDSYVPKVSPFPQGLPPIKLLNLRDADAISEDSAESVEENVQEAEEMPSTRNCFDMHLVKGKFKLGRSQKMDHHPGNVRNRATVGFWWLER